MAAILALLAILALAGAAQISPRFAFGEVMPESVPQSRLAFYRRGNVSSITMIGDVAYDWDFILNLENPWRAITELAKPTASDSEEYNISFVHATRAAERIYIWRLGACWEPNPVHGSPSAELDNVD